MHKVRPIYRTYPVYHPDHEPPGYLEKLKRLEPEVLWDDAGKRPKLETEADWIRAGELVYDAPVGSQPLADMLHLRRDRELLKRVEMPVATDGSLPGLSYVIRTKGQTGTHKIQLWHMSYAGPFQWRHDQGHAGKPPAGAD